MKRIILVGVIYLTFIALGLPDALLGSAWNQARVDLNQPIGSIGLVTFVMYMMTIFSTFLGPNLIAQFPTKTITFVSVLLTGSALILMSQVETFVLLVALAIPLGLGAGAIDMSLNHYVAVKLNASHMSYLHSFYGIGVASGPFVMAFALSLYTWRVGMILVGGILLFIALMIFLSLPVWPDDIEDTLDPPDISMARALKARGVKRSILIFTLAVHVESFMGLFVATYAYVGLGFSLSVSALATFIFYLGLTLGRVASGLLSGRVKPNTMIQVGQVFMVVAAFGLIVLPDGLLVSMALFFLMGLGSAPVYPNMMHMNTRNFKPNQVSRIISLQMVIGYVGFGIITPLFGGVLDLIHIDLFPVILLIGTILLWIITRRFMAQHIPEGRPL